MKSDQRHSRRKWISTAAVLTKPDGMIISACRTLDVSASGMKLSLIKPVALRGPVIVVLSRDGSVRRNANVVWQAGRLAGIRFDKRYDRPAAGAAERRSAG